MTGMNCADDGINCIERQRLEAEIERLTRERDEWKEKWMALAQAALTVSALEQKP